jgi:hypothetical protein
LSGRTNREKESEMKTGRNDPCPCGSGKKYKKCCLEKDAAARFAPPPASEEVAAADEWEPDQVPVETEPEEAEPGKAGSWEEPAATESGIIRDSPAAPSDYRAYPRPDQNLPELPGDQKKLVDQWWAATVPWVRKRNVDQMIKRLETALNELPEIFVHLYLHQEFIFELAGDMARQGRIPEYISLLKRVRHEQRRMYSFSHGAYDRDIISELVVTRKAEEIPAYLDLFREYPDSRPDECHAICDLLAWSGHAEQLFALCEVVAVPMLTSREVINGGFALDWLIIREEIPFFMAADTSTEALRRTASALTRLGERLQYPIGPDLGYMREALSGLLEPARIKGSSFLGDTAQIRLTMGFVSRICREGNLPWVQGIYLRGLINDYLHWSRRKKTPWLRLGKKEVEEFVLVRANNFFGVKGVPMLAILQGVVWFAEFLASAAAIPESEIKRIKADCRSLFEVGRKAVESLDPAYRLYPTFEQLIAMPATLPPPQTGLEGSTGA